MPLLRAEVDGQTVTFSVIAVDSITYAVTVAADVEAGEHGFSGIVKTFGDPQNIVGSSSVMVVARLTPEPSPEPTATAEPTARAEPMGRLGLSARTRCQRAANWW